MPELFSCGEERNPDPCRGKLDMVIVTTADPLYGQTGDGTWNHEKVIINLVADFIADLPGE